MIALPPDLNTITDARTRAEEDGDDARLFALRELELAHQALPPAIDGVRRVRLLATDAISTTWEGWNLDGGERVFLRCLRPRWKADPVMTRRMSRDATGDVSWHPDGDWPHLRSVAHGGLLIDRFPIEDVPSAAQLARTLGYGLRALAELHARGEAHPGPLAAFMVERDHRLQIPYLGRFDSDQTPSDNLRDLAETIYALDPVGSSPVAQLAEEWMVDPPPTAADGVRLLTQCLGGALLAERHRLSVAGRSTARMDRSTRLARAIRRLASLTTPPPGKFCLKAGQDGVLVIAESDGEVVRGGAATDVSEGRFLPIIYTQSQGLDAQSARFLMRSWAMRASGDVEVQAAHNADLGTTEEAASRLVRWLSAMARVRSASLILRAGRGAL